MFGQSQVGFWLVPLTIFIGLILFSGISRTAPSSYVAEIIGINGQVESRTREGSFSPASLLQRLSSQDAVRTLVSSKAELTFIDQSILVLGEKTTMEISQYRLGEREAPHARALKVLNGKVRFIVDKFFGSGAGEPEYSLDTPTLGVGIRGTDGIIEVKEAFDYVYLLQAGLPAALRSKSTGEKVDLQPGFFAVSEVGQPIRTFPLPDDLRQRLLQELHRLKAVPDVVGKTYQQAVEEMGAAGLAVGSVVVERAPNRESSEKVTKQEPPAEQSIPANRTVNLWHFDRFGSTRSDGFQPGDAQRLDRRFGAFPEIIAPDGKSIHLDTKAGLGWGIMKLESRAEALGKIKELDGPFATIKGWKESSGEKIIKGRTSTPEEFLFWDTWRMYDGSTPPTTSYHHVKLYRDVFIIGYSEHTRKFDDNLADNWDPIYENSKKLVDERFPPIGARP